LDHAGIKRLDELSTKFMGLTEAHLKLNDSINTNIAARSECLPADGTLSELLPRELQPLNLMEGHLERMSTNHSESHRSIQSISQSLSSLASHVSQLMKTHLGELSRISSAEELPDIKKAPNEIECCCDALSGIDDAFQVYKLGKQVVQNTCVYCGTIFSLEGGSDLAYRRGRHLTDPHSFGSCNLAVTYESWEELKAHLCAYHNLKEQNAMDIRRFERKRRPLISLSRSEDERNSVQTSTKEEQPNEHMIHQARLELLLRQSFDEKIPTFRFPLEICISIAFQYLDEAAFQTATDLSTNCSKQRDEIICAIEGVIVSGNDVDHSFCAKSWKKDFILDLEQSAQDLRILKDRKRKKSKVYDGRDRINEWFFEILKDSRTLISLLRGGKITTEMPPAISPEWVFSVLEFWDVDDAATGLGPHCESSDGAVDSRDDLGNETQSTKSFERNGITIRKYFGIALDEKVLEALDDPTDQAFLLKLEQDMIQFVECSQ
jgi:hypothetical protein